MSRGYFVVLVEMWLLSIQRRSATLIIDCNVMLYSMLGNHLAWSKAGQILSKKKI